MCFDVVTPWYERKNYKASIGTEDDGEFCESDENVNKRSNIQDVEACKARYCHLSHNVAMSNTNKNQGELLYAIVHFCNLSKKHFYPFDFMLNLKSFACRLNAKRSWRQLQILEFWQDVQFLFLTGKTFTRKSFAFDNWIMLMYQFLEITMLPFIYFLKIVSCLDNCYLPT